MRVTVIGGGPGGYTAAFEAARRGAEVTMVDRGRPGGTCLGCGCIPTKTLRASADAACLARRLQEYGITGMGRAEASMQAVQARKNSVIDLLATGLEKSAARLKVRLVQGEGSLVDGQHVRVRAKDSEEILESDAIILATGSMPLSLPGLEPDGVHILDSTMALELDHVPARVCIVGGGVIGCELALILRAFGSEVTIVEGQDRLLPMPGADKDISSLLAREMRKQKIRLLTGRTLTHVRREEGTVAATASQSPFVQPAKPVADEDIVTDCIIVTVGRSPATAGLNLEGAGVAADRRGWISVDDALTTSLTTVYAIGDVLGPAHVMLAHVASMEALCVVETLFGKRTPMRYDVVPSAVFTSPEIGMVGKSEDQARAEGHSIVTGLVQMRELGKAQAMGELPGFFKIVADADSGRLLGVHLAGAHASDMIAEAALALQKGLTLADIAGTIHAHPTLAEGFFEAARQALHTMQQAQRTAV